MNPIEIDHLRFTAQYRCFGGDEGVDFRVYGSVEGRWVQILRFDCFKYSPHYHYDPDGQDRHFNLDRSQIPDPIAWTVEQIKSNLTTMIREAGYASVAEGVNVAAVHAALPEIETLIRSTAK